MECSLVSLCCLVRLNNFYFCSLRGSYIISTKDLSVAYGKGLRGSNLQLMRLLYLKFEKCQTLFGKLSWRHYAEIYYTCML